MAKKKKAKAREKFGWDELKRDESITEEVILLDLRCAIRNAIDHRQADAAKDLASAYESIAAVKHRKVGY